MARRKKGTRGRPTRQAEKAEALPEESTSGSGSPEDVREESPVVHHKNTSGSGSPKDVPEEPPVVHHKKFGIRVAVADADTVPQIAVPPENIRVPVIVNGFLPPKHDLGIPERSNIVFPVEKDLPLDGSVIIKPGSFGQEIPRPLFAPLPEIPDYANIIRSMELLGPRADVCEEGEILPEISEELEDAVAPVHHQAPMDIPDMLPADAPKSPPSLNIAEEDVVASSPVISSVDSEETCESPIPLESKKQDDDSLLVPPEISSIRRSNRIRSIGILKVKLKVRSATNSPDPEKPVKVKSRWRRSSELEMHSGPEVETPSLPPTPLLTESQDEMEERLEREKRDLAEGLSLFVPIRDNEYKSARRVGKGTKPMTCDCGLTKDDIEDGDMGCGDDCLNRMMCLECGDNCALGDRCSNKAFQKWAYSDCTIFKTEKKGFGLKAVQTIPSDTFIMEYVGEVVNHQEFAKRKNQYDKEKVKHFYFMALKGDTLIDATKRGNISRFINHSCDPNAGTQMWIVNGESRIGFFSKRTIQANEEITFDYKFQRYGRKPQECFCEAANCQKWIGGSPDDDSDDSDEESGEDDEEEDEDEEVEETEERSTEMGKAHVSSDNEKSDSDMDLDSDSESRLELEKPKPKKKRGRKPKPFSERKAGRRSRWWRIEKESGVQDIGLEDEIQRLTITGVKNCAHTLMLCRLMVRAEDWPTRHRLLLLISKADTPCRKLFLDYRGLMFIHDWMISADLWSQRLEILKMLQTLPISNRRMLIDSKLLSLIEGWARRKGGLTTPSPDDANSSEDVKCDRVATDGSTPMQVSDSDSLLPDGTPSQTPNSDLSEESCWQEAKTLMTALLESWSTIKEEFRIPKKERVEQMKEHQREADLEYRRSTPFDEKLDQLSKIKLVKSNEQREREREKEREGARKEGERSRGHESPSTTYPDWFRNHRGRKMTQERRQLYALKVLREEEASRHRMQQEELWNQHKARCTGLGLDPNQHPAMDPISGCPIFFDHATRTWSQTPPYQKYQYAQQFASPYPGMPAPGAPIMSSAPNALPYPMVTYMTTPGQYPGAPAHMAAMYQTMLPRLPAHNVITLTPDQQHAASAGIPHPQPIPEELSPVELPADAPVLTAVPVNTPMKLPPRWKAAKDPRGLVYYYHIKDRKSQWEPPSWTEDQAIAEAQRVLAAEPPEESSSESSETESEEEEEEDEEQTDLNEVADDDAMETTEVQKSDIDEVSGEIADTTQPEEDSVDERSGSDEAEADEAKTVSADKEAMEVEGKQDTESPAEQPSQSDAMEADADAIASHDSPTPTRVPSIRPAAKPTKRRVGLVQERIISPRYDPLNRMEMKKYKETKLKLKRRKEEKRAALKAALKSGKKKRREKRVTSSAAESSTDKKIKENFKANIVRDIVHALNPYRKPECKIGRITSSEDFKDLARRLTNYVLAKELEHCQGVDDLRCNDSVKQKAKDFVKKYMAKFGPEYERRTE